MIFINGVPDHLHFLIGIKTTCCIADLMREIKKSRENDVEFDEKYLIDFMPWEWGKIDNGF